MGKAGSVDLGFVYRDWAGPLKHGPYYWFIEGLRWPIKAWANTYADCQISFLGPFFFLREDEEINKTQICF